MYMINDKNNEELSKAIILTFSSLNSHLEYIYRKEICKGYVGKKSHHIKCVKEYVEIIRVLCNQFK